MDRVKLGNATSDDIDIMLCKRHTRSLRPR